MIIFRSNSKMKFIDDIHVQQKLWIASYQVIGILDCISHRAYRHYITSHMTYNKMITNIYNTTLNNYYIHTQTYTYRQTHTHIYIYTRTHTYIHTYIYTHPHIYTHTHIYIHTYIYIYIHTHIHIYRYTVKPRLSDTSKKRTPPYRTGLKPD